MMSLIILNEENSPVMFDLLLMNDYLSGGSNNASEEERLSGADTPATSTSSLSAAELRQKRLAYLDRKSDSQEKGSSANSSNNAVTEKGKSADGWICIFFVFPLCHISARRKKYNFLQNALFL